MGFWRTTWLAALLALVGCDDGGILTPSAGLAPAGVDPGASGGYSDPGSFGEGPYGGMFGGGFDGGPGFFDPP